MKNETTRAVITGGTQGLGLAVARRLIAEGAEKIAICGRTAAKGESAVAELTELGAEVLYVQADLEKPEDATRSVTAAIDEFGTVNALVNCAGLTGRGGLLDTTVEMWDRQMAVNVRAPFLTMQAAVAHMKERAIPGSIVNIISMVAHCGQSYLTPYSTAKGGLSTLTKNVANAFRWDRIRCNGVLTGWMETPAEAEIQKRYHDAGDDWAEQAGKTLPMEKLVQPDELAGLVAYLVSPESGVITGSLIDYDQQIAGAYPE